MSEPLDNSSPMILHLTAAARPQAGPADLERWFSTAPFEVETVTDVYRGLAAALAPRNHNLKAVIVCVDDLAADEFEFFGIFSRLRQNVFVCIYGGERARAQAIALLRPERCADLSRDGLDVLRQLAITYRIESASQPTSQTAKTATAAATLPAAARQGENTPNVRKPSPEKKKSDHDSLAAGTNGKKQETAATMLRPIPLQTDDGSCHKSAPARDPVVPPDDATAPARVPWRAYGDVPARVPPNIPLGHLAPSAQNQAATPVASIATQGVSREPSSPSHSAPPPPSSQAPAAVPAPSAHQQPAVEDRYAPLLTPEELHALMSDDDDATWLSQEETDALLSEEE